MEKDLKLRVYVAFIWVPLLLLISYVGGILLLVFVLAATYLGLLEYTRLAHSRGLQASFPYMAVLGAGIIFSVYFRAFEFLFFVLAFATVLLCLIHLYRGQITELFPNLGLDLFGLLYIAGLFSYFIAVRNISDLEGWRHSSGARWLIFTLAVIWIDDSFAYFFGKSWGKHPLSARVSPNKTVEGAIAGAVGALLGGFLARALFLGEISGVHIVLLSLLVFVAGLFGDLVESLLKRACYLKDASDIIPGHGGVLDRFDSLLFALPVVYYYLRVIVY
jgi:phosphatidate cytidylyltransferase